jgi:hypothetical protein
VRLAHAEEKQLIEKFGVVLAIGDLLIAEFQTGQAKG